MKSFIKEMLRDFSRAKGRFVAIVAIVALGAGFFGGLKATSVDMKLTADEYYKNNNLMNFRLMSTLGVTQNDVEAVSKVEGIKQVEPAYRMDAIIVKQDNQDGEISSDSIVRLHSLPTDTAENKGINSLQIDEGRMPQSPDECVILNGKSIGPSYKMGDIIEIDKVNDPDAVEDLNNTVFTIVGRVSTPLYMSVEKGNTDKGSGSVNNFAFVPKEAFNMETYTELYATINDTENIMCYDDAYTSLSDSMKDKLENIGDERNRVRYDEVIGKANTEIADAQKEYNEKKADAEKKLKDGQDKIDEAQNDINKGELDIKKGELDMIKGERDKVQGEQDMIKGEQDIKKGEQEIADNEKKIKDAKKELLDGEKKLYDAQKEFDEKIADAEKKIADGLQEIKDNEKKLSEAEDEISSARSKIGEGRRAYETAKSQFDSQAAPYYKAIEQKKELQEQLNKLNAAPDYPGKDVSIAQLQGAIAQIEAGISIAQPQISAGLIALTSAKTSLDNGSEELSKAAAEIEKAKSELTKGKYEMRDKQNEFYEQKLKGEEELADARKELDDGKKEITDGEEKIAQAKLDVIKGKEDLAKGKQDLEKGKRDLEQGKLDLEKGKRDLADGKAKLAEAKIEYADKKTDAIKQLEEGQEKIDDARVKVDDIENPEWFVLDRSDVIGYTGFNQDADRVDAVAVVFPIFFFLVAALVCLTTMTRMVEEQRGQIGTMRALGYGKFAIISKYLIYAVITSVLGSFTGLLIGFQVFPRVIWAAYGIMYSTPPIRTPWNTKFAIIVMSLFVLCIVGATLMASFSEVMSTPAELIRPKPPKNGKRVFLENIGFIWKHMSFTQKLTARNILRYKKRFFMTVVGIAGCTALMLTGFGMKDSIGGIVPNQFGRLFLYDAQIGFTHKIDPKNPTDAQAKALTAIENDNRISDAMLFHQQNVKAFVGEKNGKGDILDAYIMMPKEIERAKDFITFQERKSKIQLEFPSEGAIVNEKLASALSLKVGDYVTIEDNDKKQNKVMITGICENYVSNYIYMSPSQYEKLYSGKTITYQAMLANITDEAKENEDALSADLLGYKEIGGVFFSSALIKNFTDVFDRLDLVVIVLIVSASMLAFVVLYNLTNINVEERVREIATIKVLGFYNMEVDSYIYRENVVLTFIGILCGFGAGVFLHQFVMRSAEVNLVMFGRNIFPLSYLWAALLTILFALAVNLVMHGRFKKIDMVESLKSIE